MVRKLNETVFDVARITSNDLSKKGIIVQDLCGSIKTHTKDAVTACLERYEEVDEGTLSVEDYIELVKKKKDVIEEVIPVLEQAQFLLSMLDD